jgi:PhnB protein
LEEIMEATNIYLTFDGNCREAITFYGKCLAAQPDFTPFSAGPPDMAASAKTAPERILHAELKSGPMVLMASDSIPGMSFRQGNNFSISISCESEAEMDRLFAALGQNGTVTMPVHDAFWGGRFGMLTDRFGIGWMLSYREPGQHS